MKMSCDLSYLSGSPRIYSRYLKYPFDSFWCRDKLFDKKYSFVFLNYLHSSHISPSVLNVLNAAINICTR